MGSAAAEAGTNDVLVINDGGILRTQVWHYPARAECLVCHTAEIDGVPYLMVEMNFRKPGKGNALYECKLKNLLRGTVVDRTYRAGQVLEEADVVEFAAQFLYRQQDMFVFMNNESYEQYELTKEQLGDAWKFLKDGTECSILCYNNIPLTVTPPPDCRS